MWYRGAFHNPRLDAPEDESSGAAEAVLPFGWAMLYRQASVADADGPPANVAWRVEPVHQGLPEDEDHDANAGRPCWLHLAVLEPGPGIDEGEELVVDRRLATAPFEGYCGEGHCRSTVNPQFDVATFALRRLLSYCGRDPTDLFRDPEADSLREELSPLDGNGPAENGPFDMTTGSASWAHPAAGVLHADLSPLHGFGVFAARHVYAGEVVEVCPVIVAEDDEVPSYGSTMGEFSHALCDYNFHAQLRGRKLVCLPVGFGVLYNHSYEPNVRNVWACSEAGGADAEVVGDAPRIPPTLQFAFAWVALRDIEKGEELFYDYGEGYWESRGLFPD